MRLSCVIAFLLFTINVNCQIGINNNWLLGYESQFGYPGGITKINFFSGTLSMSYDTFPMYFSVAHSNISDANGNVLFYTNGIYIADASNDTMVNGSGLNPSTYTTNYYQYGLAVPQADLIIPKPGSSSIFYLFHGTVDNDINVYANYLYLTTIDMTMNGGLGAVISKNIIKIQDTLCIGKITACKHANGRDWWVFCHKAYSNTFYSLLVTPYGISAPITQSIGKTITTDLGQLVFSQDGKRLAYYYPIEDVELFDFDRCSGLISNPQFVTINDSATGGGCAFSPNSNVLYVSSSRYVYQFDATAPNLASTKTTVAVWDSFESPVPGFPGLGTFFYISELAPDGKIYITTGNGTINMHVINFPDSLGAACNLIQHGITLPSWYYNTLPNHPNYFLGADTASACDTVHVGLAEHPPNILAKVSPNPTTGKFTLWFPVQSLTGSCEVYDVLGNVVLKEVVAEWSQYKHLDLSHQTSGIYLCKLKWNNNCAFVKVVKE